MDDRTRDADRIRMNSDPATRPDRAAFRDAVRDENPSTWGTMGSLRDNDDVVRRDTMATGTNLSRDVGTTTRDEYTTTTATHQDIGAPRVEPIDRRDVGVVGSAPIVGERVTDRRIDRVGTTAEPPVERRRFSIGATFLGWAVATFFSLLFLSLVAGVLGGNALTQYYGGDTTVDGGDVANYGLGALAGIVIATFLAWLIGGYAAGRISLWDGAMHGAAMIVWPILFALLGWALGATLGDDFVAATGINFDFSRIADFTGQAILGIVLTLVAMLAGGALGGRLGERYHDRADGVGMRRRTVRGRPL